MNHQTTTSLVRVCRLLLVVATCTSFASAQTQPAPAHKRFPGTFEFIAALPPEQGVRLDTHVSWIAGPRWEPGTPPTVYGSERFISDPKFTVADPNSRCLWFYRPLVPVDLSKYPILSIRYRATNFDPNATYVVRLVEGQANTPADLHKLFTGSDVISDDKAHELKTDLRDVQVTQPLKNLGIWVRSGDKGNASLQILSITFSADPKNPVEKYADDQPLKVLVTDDHDQPLAGVKVTADAERLNFARTAITNAKGEATITPLGNEINQHSLRFERDGFVMAERIAGGADRFAFKMVPASYYGGTAKDEDGKPLPHAMVMLHSKTSFTNSFHRELLNCIITDNHGRWISPPYPTDSSLFTITLSHTTDSGEAVVIDLDAANLKHAPLLHMMRMARNGRSSQAPSKPSLPSIAIHQVDDTTVTGDLTALKDGVFTLSTKSNDGKPQTQRIALDDIAELKIESPSSAAESHHAPATQPATQPVHLKGCRLEFANGDKLMGELTNWSEKQLTFQLESSNPIAIPLDQVNAIWPGSADVIRKAKALHESSSTEDIAFAQKDKDAIAVHGVALGFEGDALKFRFDGQDRKLPISRLVGVVLAHPDQASGSPQFEQLITFANSEDSLTGHLTSYNAGQLELTTQWNQPLRIPLDEVSKITCKNGKLAYLSDMKPSSVDQTPFFDRIYAYKTDTSLDGKTIQIQDGTYPHGISVHSRCLLTYDLAGRYDEFRSKVGFQQPEGKLGNCIVRVLADGETLFEKLDARGDEKAFDVNVPITGCHKLTLEVDYGKDQDVGDRLVWANARVLKTK